MQLWIAVPCILRYVVPATRLKIVALLDTTNQEDININHLECILALDDSIQYLFDML